MKNFKVVWIFQAVAAVILIMAVIPKFAGAEESKVVFTALKMEPTGRYLIGGLESLAALLLIIPHCAAYGAILTAGVMTGAVIAHLSKLGLEGPTGSIGGLAFATLFVAVVILYLRRLEIPIINSMFEKGEDADLH
jgi:putative oxidoreductase